MWILSYCLGVQYSHYKLMDGLSHNLCLNFDAMMTGIIIANVPTASKRRSHKQQPQRGSNNHNRVSILFTQWSQTPSDTMYSCFAHQYFWDFPFPSTFPACWYKSCAAESSCSFLLWGDSCSLVILRRKWGFKSLALGVPYGKNPATPSVSATPTGAAFLLQVLQVSAHTLVDPPAAWFSGIIGEIWLSESTVA